MATLDLPSYRRSADLSARFAWDSGSNPFQFGVNRSNIHWPSSCSISIRMKNPHGLFAEVLVQKERELDRVRKELEALRLAAALLHDDEDGDFEPAEPNRSVTIQ